MYEVHKFGGASIGSLERIKNTIEIIKSFRSDSKIIIFSAMGKVTNMLEEIIISSYKGEIYFNQFEKLKNYHYGLIEKFYLQECDLFSEIDLLFEELKKTLKNRSDNYQLYYDQNVVYGELISTKIMSVLLNLENFDNQVIDARDIIMTDDNYCNANINWTKTKRKIIKYFKKKNIITQGFIGSNENYSTTLGREGSDFTAAIISNCLEIKKLTIWKDVPGLMNCDPKIFKSSIQFKEVPYDEVIELAHYGAKVIHPRTIKPLKEKNINLIIRSFENLKSEGTSVFNHTSIKPMVPSVILKKNQVLISVSNADLSLFQQKNFNEVLEQANDLSINLNIVQSSAISCSFTIDQNFSSEIFLKKLEKKLKVNFNNNLSLVTIRHYNQQIVKKVIFEKKIYLQQKSRNTVSFVLKF